MHDFFETLHMSEKAGFKNPVQLFTFIARFKMLECNVYFFIHRTKINQNASLCGGFCSFD